MFRLEDESTYFEIEDYYVSFETGLPGVSYSMKTILGDGGIVSGIGSLGGRTAKITRAFTKLQETDRDNFIEWYTSPSFKKKYLRKTTTNFDGIALVQPVLQSGESFNIRNMNFAKELSFEMLMANPYFESTSATSTSVALTSSTQSSAVVTIAGQKVFPSFSFTSTDAYNIFEVKTGEGFGFRIDYPFGSGDVIDVSTTGSALVATLNGGELNGYFTSESRPFNLFSSQNNLFVRAASGTLTVNYNKRLL